MSRTRPGRVFFLRTAQCTNMAPLRGSSDGDDSLVSSTTSADSEPTLQVGLRVSYCSSYLTAIWRTVCGTDLALIKTRYGRSLAISTATRSDSTKITRSTQEPRECWSRDKPYPGQHGGCREPPDRDSGRRMPVHYRWRSTGPASRYPKHKEANPST